MGVDDRGASCGRATTFGGTGRMSTESLARPNRQGIELLPRPPATESGTARRRGSVRHEPACRSVAQRLGDEAAGTRRTEVFDRKRHRTGHPEGPLRLILARALLRFRVSPSVRRPATNELPSPQRSRSTVGIGAFPVDSGVSSCGPPGVFRWNQRNVRASSCVAGSRGHRTSPTPPATESGTARRRGFVRRRTSLLGSRRGGWVTKPPGPGLEERSTGSVASTGHQKGPWDSYSRGPFAMSAVEWAATPLGPTAEPRGDREMRNRLTRR
jgi:hypothetical protein